MDQYVLNPFSFVTETDASIMINTTGRLRAQFAKQHRPIVDMLIARCSIPADELGGYLAPSRVHELVAKRILLPSARPSLEGRYSRQLGFLGMLSLQPEALQARLETAHVLLLGAGAVGSHVLWNLAAMGVGRLTVVDFDVVDETNLNRQLMYTPEDIGRSKVDVLTARIRQFNPLVDVRAVSLRIASAEDIARLLPGCDLVVKAIDTPEQSTAWLNEACVAARIPYVTGGFLDYVGVVGPIYVPGKSLCSACFGYGGTVKRLHGTGPTFAPLTTIVSSMVAMTAFKILTGGSDPMVDTIQSYDTATGEWLVERLRAQGPCGTCGATPPPVPAAVADPAARRLGWFRGGIATLLGATVIVREGFDQPMAGAITLCAVLLSMGVLRLVAGPDSARARREAFVTACLYVGVGAGSLALQAWWQAGLNFPGSLAQLFDLLHAASIAVLEVAIGIASLFFLLSGALSLAERLAAAPTPQKA